LHLSLNLGRLSMCLLAKLMPQVSVANMLSSGCGVSFLTSILSSSPFFSFLRPLVSLLSDLKMEWHRRPK
jgi:hypothetical protein